MIRLCGILTGVLWVGRIAWLIVARQCWWWAATTFVRRRCIADWRNTLQILQHDAQTRNACEKKHQIEFVSLLRFGIPFASNADVERVAVEKPVDAVPAAAPYSAMRTFRCPSVAVAFCDSRLRWALFSNAKTTAASHFSDPLDARPSAEFARGSRPTTLHPVDHALRAPYANVPPRPRPLVLQCAWCVWGVWYVWCVCASTYPPFSSAFPALYAPWGPAIVNLLALF